MKTLHLKRSGLFILLGTPVFFLTFAAPVLYACSVPVFRYAIERWNAEPYIVEIMHRGVLSGEGKAAAELLESFAQGEKQVPVNLTVRYIDAKNQTQMTVYFPVSTRKGEPVWDRPLIVEDVKKLVESPMRKSIVDRLLDGDSAVWVLLESGDRQKDDAAAALLTEQLKLLQNTLKLSVNAMIWNDGTSISDNGQALRISFSLVRLRRDDPKEAFLVASLLRTEPDLMNLQEPMVFPVFGRGCVLYALVGKGINQYTIRDACEFIIGPCLCEVKAQNPGVDLLLAADWDEVLDKQLVVEEPLPPLTGVFPTSISAEVNEIPASESTRAETDSARSESGIKPAGTAILMLAIIAVLVMAASVVVVRRRKAGE